MFADKVGFIFIYPTVNIDLCDNIVNILRRYICNHTVNNCYIVNITLCEYTVCLQIKL